LPIGTAYAVWTGIGALGAFVFGILLFKEPIDFWRVFFISLLIIALVGLKKTSGV
jgi:quaternary ammonium compound-resistance protein SugE